MVEIGTSSIVDGGVVQRRQSDAEVGVGYTEESFIAQNFNQHEETMFDDYITSALLNGISNSNAANNNVAAL